VSAFDPFARYYDADHGAFTDDIPFYREMARRTGGPILEVMCGSGRVLAPLAADGHAITGLDISPRLLALAREKLASAGRAGRAELVVGDARHAVPRGPFALAIIALNSFMHLTTVDDQLAALRQIHAALRPGGVLAIDLFNPDPRELARRGGELVFDKAFTLSDGTVVHKFVAQRLDAAEQTSHVTFFYDEQLADGTVRRAALPFTMRWLYRYELEHLLARAGFVLETVYGSYDLDDYSSASEQMLAVAVRPG
jgi:SAM-dependent methyltransferase